MLPSQSWIDSPGTHPSSDEKLTLVPTSPSVGESESVPGTDSDSDFVACELTPVAVSVCVPNVVSMGAVPAPEPNPSSMTVARTGPLSNDRVTFSEAP